MGSRTDLDQSQILNYNNMIRNMQEVYKWTLFKLFLVYLQSECYTLEGIEEERVDEKHEFERLRQSMEMVGFSTLTQKR